MNNGNHNRILVTMNNLVEEIGPRWWEGGFPVGLKATEPQKFAIQKRAHHLTGVLSKTEFVAMRLMGFKNWLNELPRDCATIIIGKIKEYERQLQQERIANDVRYKEEDVKRKSNGCFVCGGHLSDDPVSPVCAVCGAPCIRLSL